MTVELFFYQLLHKREWQRALDLPVKTRNKPLSLLRELTHLRLDTAAEAQIRWIQQYREESISTKQEEIWHLIFHQLQDLSKLEPFLEEDQTTFVHQLWDTAMELKNRKSNSVTPPPENYDVIYYSVKIPSLKSSFYYMSNTPFVPGDIVEIPFGKEESNIYGIVESVNYYTFRTAPLPLWKMKYIYGFAPPEIVSKYLKMRSKHSID